MHAKRSWSCIVVLETEAVLVAKALIKAILGPYYGHIKVYE